jgi:fucose 4-O-acetylase-like acetyltransferase
MESGQNKDRHAWIDVAKGLGIIAVVVGHSGAPTRLVAFVYVYHLYLFFFLSGVLFSPRYAHHPLEMARKRLRSLYLPFVAYQAAFLVCHGLLFRLLLYENAGTYPVGRIDGLPAYLKAFVGLLTLSGIEQIGGAMWFIIALVLTTAFFGFAAYISVILGRGHSEIFLASVTLVMVLAGFFNVYPWARPAYVNTSLVATGFYYAGYTYRRFQDRVPVRWWTAVVAFGVVFWSTKHGFAYIGVNNYSSFLFLAVIPLTGIYANVALARSLRANRMLESLGRHSLAILALHFLAFKTISGLQVIVRHLPPARLAAFPVIDGSGGWWILYTLVGLALPAAAAVAAMHLRPSLIGVFKPQRAHAEW